MNIPHWLQIGADPVRRNLRTGFIFLGALTVFPAFAQTYSIDWHTIAGGGGTSTSATYQVTGTIGQADASAPLTGGSYSVTGGFWSLVSAVQTAGVPDLRIVPNGLNSVKILWPATGSFTLEQNNNLAKPTGWTANSDTITTANGTNSVTITPPTGNLFFRLANPL